MINNLRELWQYRELIGNLVVRDLKVRYKNSLLGILWSWLNPLLMMLVFTLVFTVMWGNPIPNYHILALSGLLPWNYFAGAVMGGMTSLVSGGHLLKKVYFPREILPLAVVFSNLVNYLMGLPVFLVLALLSGQGPWATWLLIPLPLLVQTLFIIGLVLVLSTLEVFYRDTHMVMDVLITAWFFLTPIFYRVEQFPEQAQLLGVSLNPRALLLLINPMAAVVTNFQDVMYHGTLRHLPQLGIAAALSLGLCVIGYILFRRHSGKFSEII